jgi:hypothetical protein
MTVLSYNLSTIQNLSSNVKENNPPHFLAEGTNICTPPSLGRVPGNLYIRNKLFQIQIIRNEFIRFHLSCILEPNHGAALGEDLI